MARPEPHKYLCSLLIRDVPAGPDGRMNGPRIALGLRLGKDLWRPEESWLDVDTGKLYLAMVNGREAELERLVAGWKPMSCYRVGDALHVSWR